MLNLAMDNARSSCFGHQNSSSNQGVLAAAASGLESFITQVGGDIDTILGRSGVDPEILNCPTASLKLTSYCIVLEQAAKQSGCDHFGLYYGKQFMPQHLGLIGYIGLCSSTVEQALKNVANAFHWHQHDTYTQLVDLNDAWRFDYQIRHGAIVNRRQDAELTIGMIVNLVRSGMGTQWVPREVHFEHPAPEQWHEHCKIFDAPVYFNQPCNSVVITKQQLSRSMPNHDAILLQLMFETLKKLNSSSTEQSFVDQVRSQIQIQLPQGEPELDIIAHSMGDSRVVLQRKLRTEGVTFRQLVERVRCDMAKHYLQQGNIHITEMGMILGYSETSAFSRAFRRWFGVSPSKYKRSLV